MAKKFFDIVPPPRKRESPQRIELGYKGEKEKKDIFGSLQSSKFGKSKNFEQRRNTAVSAGVKILFFSLIFLILAGIFGFLIFSKVKVEIWPETAISAFETNINIEIEKSGPDLEARIIPGKVFEDQRTASKEFSASGKTMKEEKAKGVIRVFNEYSVSAQGLLPNTRFVSDKGKLFRSLKREVIPGGHYEKGKLAAGFVDIEVIAAEPGEDYNIGPSTFSIPGFKGTSKYTYFYGKSSSPMTAGFKGEVSQVTDDDIKKAELALSGELKEESKNFLKKIIPVDYILLDETIFQDIKESNSSLKAGSEGELFNLQIKVESKGVGFRKSDIDEFIRQFIASNISEDETFEKESLGVNYSLKLPPLSTGNGADNILESEKIILDVKVKAKIYQNINLGELKKALAGKSLKETRMFLGDLPRLTKVEIKSWPFLRRKIPDDMNKIELKLKLNPDR